VPRAVRPALLALWQAGPVLNAARSDPARVADGRLDPGPGSGRLTLLARAATGRW